MTKLKYPELGIIKTQEALITGIQGNINTLVGTTFEVPGSIDDVVLKTFPQIAEGFNNDFKKIKESFERSDKNYKLLDIQIQNEFKNITVDPMSKRDKIV